MHKNKKKLEKEGDNFPKPLSSLCGPPRKYILWLGKWLQLGLFEFQREHHSLLFNQKL
jgi:hypothetical protein